jgi:glycosyltransferase involved in cell wall biosynthesis
MTVMGDSHPIETSVGERAGLPRVSVIIPAYNEEQSIAGVLRQMRALPFNPEIIVVDDGSRDRTGEIAAAEGARVLCHPINRGYGAALRTGIRAATGDLVAFIDADGQHEAGDLARLVEHITRHGYDMVVGARPWNSGAWHRNLANWIYNRFASYITGTRVQDLNSGLRVIRASLVKSMCYLLPNTFSASTTMTLAVARGGFGTDWVPIHVKPRIGKSKISLLRDGARFFVIMTRITMLFSPLKVLGPLGLLVAAPGFFYAIYRLLIGRNWTIPITISLTMGALILVLGLISEQIATLRLQRME